MNASDDFPRVPGFRLERELASGAAGQVFLARREGDPAPLALKLLRLEAGSHVATRERFEREARLLQQAPHPGIVPLLEVDLTATPPYLVFPYMAGGDLRDAARRGGMGPQELRPLGARLAGALAHLHRRGILHRDLKPANVVRDDQGLAYLTDLGLGVGGSDRRLTATGWMVGTPDYMAPELAHGEPQSPASDVYALAVLLVELALGERPARAAAGAPLTATQVAALGASDLARALVRALAEDPEDRTPDGASFLEDWEAADGPGAPAPPEGRTRSLTRALLEGPSQEPPAPVAARRGRMVAAAGALGVGLLVGRALAPAGPGGLFPPTPGTWTTTEDRVRLRPPDGSRWDLGRPRDSGEVLGAAAASPTRAYVLDRGPGEEVRLMAYRPGTPEPMWVRRLFAGHPAPPGAPGLRVAPDRVEVRLTPGARFVWDASGAVQVSPDRTGL